jgi:hypothetical protein
MKNRMIVLLMLGLAVAGCETYYVVPDSGPEAKVRFTSLGTGQSIMVTSYSSEKCERGKDAGIMGVVGGINVDPLGNVPSQIKESGNTQQMMGYPGNAPIRPIERRIRADRPFVFALYRIVGGMPETRTCTLSYVLEPMPGAEYEVEYGEDPTKCGVTVYRLERDGSSARRVSEPSARPTARVCPGA